MYAGRYDMLIPFPSFESNLTALLDGAEELRCGDLRAAASTLTGVRNRLVRVRGSARHEQLSGFVVDALAACGRGERDYALYVLMSALSTFIPRAA